jgi:hypothetical protein
MRVHCQIIADNLSKAGWSWGWVSAVDSEGQTIWIADAHCGDGKRFIVHADEKLTAFLELESAIHKCEKWRIIAKNLSKAGWNCGCISSTDHKGRQFWVAAAAREDAGRFIVDAYEKLTAFLKLEATIWTHSLGRTSE